jgi:chemotaxis protein methyltransferase CheR
VSQEKDVIRQLADNDQLEEIEIDLLLEGLFRRYGYDFRSYSCASIRRRIWNFIKNEQISTVSALQERLLHDPTAMDRFVLSLTVNVTAMFRDPLFFKAVRTKIVPLLKTYPFIRIWDAGCSSGEEAYSLAVILQEEGIYDRCRIYATDMNESVLKRAKAGIFSLSKMKEYTDNYLQAGGTQSFSQYYTAKYDHAILQSSLKRNIVFAQHNLVTDRSFNEFHFILIRNVLIYFNDQLRNKVLDLLHSSLVNFGVLALGRKESLKFTDFEHAYEELEVKEKLYKRVV